MEGRPEGDARESRLILADSSVWIDFFSSAPGRAGDELWLFFGRSENQSLDLGLGSVEKPTRFAAGREGVADLRDDLVTNGLLR